MFANTQMMGVDLTMDVCKTPIAQIGHSIERALSQRAITPAQAEILRDMQRVLELLNAQLRNQAGYIRTQQVLIKELAGTR